MFPLHIYRKLAITKNNVPSTSIVLITTIYVLASFPWKKTEGRSSSHEPHAFETYLNKWPSFFPFDFVYSEIRSQLLFIAYISPTHPLNSPSSTTTTTYTLIKL